MYHWFSKYPTKLSEYMYNLISPLNCPEDKDIYMEETGSYSAIVVSLMAEKKVGIATRWTQYLIWVYEG